MENLKQPDMHASGCFFVIGGLMIAKWQRRCYIDLSTAQYCESEREEI